ncbi:IucA/IucC family C-terminal-domain containing protein [Peribacillus asahii]|uniref:IucA/IucC family C-terminal-domain containing protein n=1 Tax=Peribacillus asahii TaxID=228899 RepID=UPI000FDAD8DA|nr:IucA/IucC family C-terminal-domain containing protein [Peribacillus asahii]USK83729.1 (2Fe-2S)-binding protein [Peribacillus asahii]
MNSSRTNEILLIKKKFHIYDASQVAEVMTVTDLLEEEKCRLFLQKQMQQLQAPSLSVTASMFSKRYAYLVVASTLYSMVEFNGVFVLPLKACSFSTKQTLSIQEYLCQWNQGMDGTREQWREKLLQELFSNHITPVWNMLKKISGISSAILWENLAVRINSVYRKVLEQEVTSIKKQRVDSDFHYLKGASGELFDLLENPISRFLKIGEELHIHPDRQTCCLYYQLKEDMEGIGYCTNCPIGRKRKRREK